MRSTSTAIVMIVLTFSTAFAQYYNATSTTAGSAIIVNECSRSIYLNNVPAAGGGYGEIHQTLPPHGRYEQRYTPLTNDNGWSIKLCKDDSFQDGSILQFEYTWHPIASPNVIWFDVSQVNGNPWPDDYWISAVGPGCTPKQHAYRYPTDDRYGMQACPSSADITVTLCRSEVATDGSLLPEAVPSISSRSVESSTNGTMSSTAVEMTAPDTVIAQPTAASCQDGEECFHHRSMVDSSLPTEGDTEPAIIPTPTSSMSTVRPNVITIFEKIVVEESVIMRPHGERYVGHD